jgi:hypothetical protein
MEDPVFSMQPQWLFTYRHSAVAEAVRSAAQAPVEALVAVGAIRVERLADQPQISQTLIPPSNP